MRTPCLRVALALGLFSFTSTLPLAALTPAAAPQAAIPAWQAYDWVGFLKAPKFPAPCPASVDPPDVIGSDTLITQVPNEIAAMVWLQRTRTAADIARARNGAHRAPSLFDNCLPDSGKHLGDPGDTTTTPAFPHLDPDYPLTYALMEQAYNDISTALKPVKLAFSRTRPYVEYPKLISPAVELENTKSYPSAHAVYGIVMANILSVLDPDLAKQFMERGHQIGDDRVLAGLHHPTDVEADQLFGQQFAQLWLGDPGIKAKVVAALRAEWTR